MPTPAPKASTRRAEERRARQRDDLILAAERRIAEAGVANLRARDLAQDIGVALGAIYNLVADMDELILLVIERTLSRLDAVLEEAARILIDGTPAEQLEAIAKAYLGFARDHTMLWRSVFDYRMPEDRELPARLAEQQASMFRHVMRPLEALLPSLPAPERQIFAHTLFTATHGVVQLSLEQRLFAVPPAEIERQLTRLVFAVAKGVVD
jgi:AcrR family transcriptional regulator